MTAPGPALPLAPWKVTRLLLLLVAGLALASLGGRVSKFVLGIDHGFGLVQAFNMNREGNVPSWFSSSLLLLGAILLGLIAAEARRIRRPFARHWSILTLLCAWCSLDEAISIHEGWTELLRPWVPATGMFHYAWVIPAGLFVLLVAVGYWKFFWQLPRRTRRLLMLAAVLYVGGAIGMELVTWPFVFAFGKANLGYGVLSTLEESLEMLGVVALIHALLLHIEREGPVIKVQRGD